MNLAKIAPSPTHNALIFTQTLAREAASRDPKLTISNKALEMCAGGIFRSLTRLINLSLSSGEYPKLLENG